MTSISLPLIVAVAAGAAAALYAFFGAWLCARHIRGQMARISPAEQQRAWSVMAHPQLLEEHAGKMAGPDGQLLVDLQCLAQRLGCTIKLSDGSWRGLRRTTGGMFFNQGTKPVIALSPRLTPEMQVSVLAHEIGHAMLHGTRLINLNKQAVESEAELFACAMLRAYGHPVGRQAAYLKRINGDGDEWYADAAIRSVEAVRVALGYLDWLSPRR